MERKETAKQVGKEANHPASLTGKTA